MTDIKYWVAFKCIPTLGPVRFRRLEAYFGSLEQAWIASAEEMKAAGIDNRSAQAVISGRSKVSPDGEMIKQVGSIHYIRMREAVAEYGS